MARNTGPACRLCRRAGVKLFLKGERCFAPKCAVERRPYAPGQHGQKRRKISEYGTQLGEKQKLRHIYGTLERQFRRYLGRAERLPGLPGENLLQLLEMRLDNIVYRLGFADSRRQARQLVEHGHFAVNGRKSRVPSTVLKPGNTIEVLAKSLEDEYFRAIKEEMSHRTVPSWLTVDREAMRARVLTWPSVTEVEASVQPQLIVEYYSR